MRVRMLGWVLLALVVGVLACIVGGSSLGALRALRVLFEGGAAWERAVLLEIRLPRVVLGLLSGGALGLSGAAMQGLFRNGLAEPSVLGVSSGATLGALVALYSGWAATELVPFIAFGFALGSVLVVHRLAIVFGRARTSSLLLAGIAVSSALGALSSMVLSLSLARWELGQQMLSWLMGGLEGRTWAHVLLVTPPILLGSLPLLALWRDLDALALSEESAASLGVDVPKLRRSIAILVSLLTAATVATIGNIAFVGLIAPHCVRATLGPSHRWVLPFSALVGAIALVLADLVSRSLSGIDIRPGALTSLVGAPFFLWLIARQRRLETGA